MDKHPTTRYPNETVDEFEKNVVHKHHDNVTQWVNKFSKKRGWFVQVWNQNSGSACESDNPGSSKTSAIKVQIFFYKLRTNKFHNKDW